MRNDFAGLVKQAERENDRAFRCYMRGDELGCRRHCKRADALLHAALAAQGMRGA